MRCIVRYVDAGSLVKQRLIRTLPIERTNGGPCGELESTGMTIDRAIGRRTVMSIIVQSEADFSPVSDWVPGGTTACTV